MCISSLRASPAWRLACCSVMSRLPHTAFMYVAESGSIFQMPYSWLSMRSFISSVALFVKVTARIFLKQAGLSISSFMYSTASVNVFPLPALALYTVNGFM